MKNPISNLSDAELYQACKRASNLIHQGTREFEAYLPEVNRRRLHRRRGFASIHEFGAKMANMSHEKVDTILRLAKRIEDKPALKRLFEQGIVSYCKLKKVAYIATVETDEMWAEKVVTLTQPALEIFVRNYRLKNGLQTTDEPEKSTSSQWNRLSFPVKPEVEAKLRQMKHQLEKTRGEKLTLNEVLEALLKGAKIEESRAKVEVCPDCVTRREQQREKEKQVTRTMPNPVKQVVETRQGEKCAFPGCTKPPEIFHHTRRFALKKSHDPDFIVGLCKAHERLVHSGLVENEEGAPEQWQIRDEAPWWDLKNVIDQRVMEFRGG